MSYNSIDARLLRPSTTSYCRFSLHRHRSTPFGLYPNDLGAVNTLTLKTCGDLLSLRLSSRLTKKLPGPLFRTYVATPKRRYILSLICFRSFHTPSKSTFQLSLTVLIRYRSCVIFRFGGQCPPHSRLISNRHYSGNPQRPRKKFLRDYHPLRFLFPENLEFFPGLKEAP